MLLRETITIHYREYREKGRGGKSAESERFSQGPHYGRFPSKSGKAVRGAAPRNPVDRPAKGLQLATSGIFGVTESGLVVSGCASLPVLCASSFGVDDSAGFSASGDRCREAC